MMLARLFLVFAVASGCAGGDFSATAMRGNSQTVSKEAIAPRSVSTGTSSSAARPYGAPVVDPAYAGLRAAFETYQDLAARGGWASVSPGKRLETGSHGPRVVALRQRLSVTADLTEVSGEPEEFDLPLEAAVRRFQARHGLEPDGIVGVQTLAELNVPIGRRLATMKVNLSRLLNGKRDWGARYVVVNVAAASYGFVENGRSVLEGPSVVGRPDWPTPPVDGIIEHIEFHPYWTIPPRIAAREVWPRAKRDPGYLRRNHMRVVDGRLRQDPGPDNPLGKVKFIFPNPYSVYLHDTNHPELLAQAKRFRSHGCVRISDALNLARMLLRDDAAWPEARIDAVIAGGRNTRVPLVAPVPVHLVYDTAWVDDRGIVQFRDDVYGRDRGAIAAPLTAAAATESYGGCGANAS